MRIHETTLYTFDELSEDAQGEALKAVSDKLGGDWWDSNDNDDIREVMTYALAAQLGTPGHENYGCGDFPGIPGIKLDGWDLDRGQRIDVRGIFTPENAPNLPWKHGIAHVVMRPNRHVEIDVHADDETLYVNVAATAAAVTAMEQAIREALAAAWQAGEKEAEYKSSEEAARDWIESNAPEFEEDGTLWS